MEAKVDLTVLASCRTALGSGDGATVAASPEGADEEVGVEEHAETRATVAAVRAARSQRFTEEAYAGWPRPLSTPCHEADAVPTPDCRTRCYRWVMTWPTLQLDPHVNWLIR